MQKEESDRLTAEATSGYKMSKSCTQTRAIQQQQQRNEDVITTTSNGKRQNQKMKSDIGVSKRVDDW